MGDSLIFFPDVFDFDQKKKAQKDPGGNGCGCVSEGEKNKFSILSRQSLSVTSIVLKERK